MQKLPVIFDLLRSDGSIVINKRLARTLGLDCAIMYAELISKYIYFHNEKMLTEDGFFYNTIIDMEKDTTLSGKQQRSAIQKLSEMSLIECEVRGMPATRHFRISQDESVLLGIIHEEESGCQLFQNGTSSYSEMEHPVIPKRNTNNTNITILKNNTKKDKDITAKADLSSNTLFDLPKAPAPLLSRIEQARKNGVWGSVTTSDFVQYFVERQNEIFPEKIHLPKSKDGNYLVSMFRKNFIERYQIDKVQVCDQIDKILQIYRETESDPKYRNCFDLSAFKLEWKIDKLMKYRDDLADYGTEHEQTEYKRTGSEQVREIF
jgi:hypothetical protein